MSNTPPILAAARSVLCVDNDSAIVRLLAQCLASEFRVVTAEGGRAALEQLEAAGPFGVVLSDLSMPEMDGAAFLAEVLKRSPDTVQIAMTGHAEVTWAVSAVNSGRVYRFMTKPFGTESIIQVVREASARYLTRLSERRVVEETLQSTTRMLIQVLALIQPATFGRSERVAGYVKRLAARLHVHDVWRFEMAARLSHLGCVTLPSEIVTKVYAGQELDSHEAEVYSFHPYVAFELLSEIPHLQDVAEIVRRQNEPDWGEAPASTSGADLTGDSAHHAETDLALGAQMLSLAIELDRRVAAGSTPTAALEDLRWLGRTYDPRLIAACEGLRLSLEASAYRIVSSRELEPGMTLDEDVRSPHGVLLCAKGQGVTNAVVQRLGRMSEDGAVVEPFRVLVRSAA